MIDIKIYASSSKGNLYKIGDGITALLIDPGLPIKKIKEALNFKLSEVQGCLCSHGHLDHSKGILDLIKAGIDVYCTEGTSQEIGINGHRYHVIKAGEQFRIGTWEILPFKTIHNASEPVGFLLVSGSEKLSYACDTQYVPHRFRGLTHVLLECNYDMDILKKNVRQGHLDVSLAKKIIGNHLALSTVKNFLLVNDMSKVQEIHLIHLSQNNSNTELFREEIMRISGRPVYIGG